jgi:hypothetical protein
MLSSSIEINPAYLQTGTVSELTEFDRGVGRRLNLSGRIQDRNNILYVGDQNTGRGTIIQLIRHYILFLMFPSFMVEILETSVELTVD